MSFRDYLRTPRNPVAPANAANRANVRPSVSKINGFSGEAHSQTDLPSHQAESKDPANGGRELRQSKVEAELRTHPELRVAFDVIDSPIHGESGNSVRLILAIRHGELILSGELHVPREQWDLAALLAVTEVSVRPS